MKKIAPLALLVVLTVFAQQQNTTQPAPEPVPAPIAPATEPAPVPVAPTVAPIPAPIPQEIIPEPEVPLVPALPLPEEIIQTEPPQPPQPVLLPIDPKDTLPLPPLPPLPPSPLPQDTTPVAPPVAPVAPQAIDSARVVPTPAPAPAPKDTTPQVAPTPAPAPAPKDTTPPKPSLPMNTITVDLGPTIIGVGINAAAKALGNKLKNVEISAFGIGAQYEYQPIRFLSLPLKFAYMDFKTSFKEDKTFKIPLPPLTEEQQDKLDDLHNEIDNLDQLGVPVPDSLRNLVEIMDSYGKPKLIDTHTELEAKLSILSIEAHPRLYPFGGSFFLEGMVGYANLATSFKGNVNVPIKFPELAGINIPDTDIPIPTDTVYDVNINHKISRDYLKYGGKLGWRVDFGKPGGFIFEHALGFYGASGFGKTIVKQLADYAEGEVDKMIAGSIYEGTDYKSKADIGKFDDAFSLLEKFILVGGPRYTFAFGWRF